MDVETHSICHRCQGLVTRARFAGRRHCRAAKARQLGKLTVERPRNDRLTVFNPPTPISLTVLFSASRCMLTPFIIVSLSHLIWAELPRPSPYFHRPPTAQWLHPWTGFSAFLEREDGPRRRAPPPRFGCQFYYSAMAPRSRR